MEQIIRCCMARGAAGPNALKVAEGESWKDPGNA